MAKKQGQRSIGEILWESAKEPFQAKKRTDPTQADDTSAGASTSTHSHHMQGKTSNGSHRSCMPCKKKKFQMYRGGELVD